MGKRSRRRGEQTEPQEATEQADDAPSEGAPARLRPDGRLREVALLVEEADYLLALYRSLVLLRREGFRVNRKRIYRLYTQEGLTVRRRKRRRRHGRRDLSQ